MASRFKVVEEYGGRHVLLTGARGFLAASFLRLLSAANCRITCLSHVAGWEPRCASGPARLEFRIDDLADVETWRTALSGVNTVFHLAAQTSARIADEDPQADYHANVLPALTMFVACRGLATRPTVVMAGTVTQAGAPRQLPVDEAAPDQPLSIYDLHKCLAERYLAYYRQQGVVRGAMLRLPNLYGPGPQSSAADRGVLNQMIRRALDGQPLTVYTPGTALRDYLYVDDAARAFLMTAARAERLEHGHYVVGTGRGHTIAEAIQLVAERAAHRLGGNVPVVHQPSPVPLSELQLRSFVANPARLCQATSWHAECDLTTGIDRTIEALSCAT